MMLYRTKWGDGFARILGRYGASEAAIVALETLALTIQADCKQAPLEELAKKTCRGLHMDAPGRGVVCAKCFDAAFSGVTEKALTGDQLARVRPRLSEETGEPRPGAVPGQDVPISVEPEPDEPSIEEIHAETMKLLQEPGRRE